MGKKTALFLLPLTAFVVGGFFSFAAAGGKEERNLALMLAAHNGTVKEVRAALSAGGNVNAARFGPGGMTPLMYAAANNPDGEVITALLKAGADAKARRGDGETALMLAARSNKSPAAAKALLRSNAVRAGINDRDWRGETALHQAVTKTRETAVAEALVLAGADGAIKSDDGYSAFLYATRELRFRDNPIFLKASPAMAAAKAKRDAARKAAEEAARLRAERKARGEPEPESAPDAGQEDAGPEYNTDASKYDGEPRLLSEAERKTPVLSENAGIDLDRYDMNNPNAELPRLGAAPAFSLFAKAEMPVLDGALASFPLYSAFARACYTGLAAPTPKTWRLRYRGFAPASGVVEYRNTTRAFVDLIDKGIDIFFGLGPNAEQKALAAEKKAELAYTSLGREAFVFFVHKDNPVTSLTRAQIKDIYAGKVTNWKQVGGLDQPILAFQRNKGSGSQSALERFMGDAPLGKPPVDLVNSMEGIVLAVAKYRDLPNALGYTFYFFATRLAANENVKLLAVDGIAPNPEHIRDRSYPLLETRWAITLKENKKPAVARFLKWMQGPQGQEIVKLMGYVGNE